MFFGGRAPSCGVSENCKRAFAALMVELNSKKNVLHPLTRAGMNKQTLPLLMLL